MRPHPRIRKVVKWGGIVVTTLIAAAWCATFTRGVMYYRQPIGCAAMGGGGIVLVYYMSATNSDLEPGLSAWTHMGASGGWFDGQWNTELIGVRFPLLVPLVLVALPTALAWRLDTLARRRAKVNACPACGYDRSGLARSSPCPECGTSA